MTGSPKFLVNGQFTDTIPVQDRGLRYGDGCFETMLYRHGHVQLWDRHFGRLMHGCERLKIQLDFDREILEQEIALLVEGIEEAIVRITVTRGSGGSGYAYPDAQSPTRILGIRTDQRDHAKHQEQGVDICLCNTIMGRNPLLAGIKHLNRLEQVLARSEWADEFLEGLLKNDVGDVIEGTMSNLFLVENGAVFTPFLDECGVAGVMRAELMQRMPEMGIEVAEERISVERLLAADECFLTNSLIGIWPVRSINGNYKTIGGLTRKLISVLDEIRHS